MTITAQPGEFAFALQPAKYEEGQHSNVLARGYIDFTTLPSNSNTVTVAGQAYTFSTTAASAGQITIGATIADCLKALADAVNGQLNAAVFAGTLASSHVVASTEGTRIYFTALNGNKSVGNALALATTVTGTTVVGFAGGINGAKGLKAFGRIIFTGQPTALDTVTIGSMVYTFVSGTPAAYSSNDVEVRIGSTLKQTVERLARAINASGIAGTDYSSGTPAHSSAYSDSLLRDLVVTVYASAVGTGGNSIVLDKSGTNISVTGSGTLIGGLAISSYPLGSLSWIRTRTVQTDYQEMQMQDILPFEVGGNMTPTGAYKQGVAVGGSVALMPRLEGSIGELLLAALGKAEVSVSDGVGTHTFTFANQEIDIPWVAARRMVPGRDGVFGHGIVGMDNKVASLRTLVQATAPVQMEAQLIGRVPLGSNHPEVWTGSSFEDFESIPLACKGAFTLPPIPGFKYREIPVTAVSVDLVNSTTGPRQEMVVGSYFMDDVVPLVRAMTFTATYKWQDPDLYRLLFGGTVSATEWAPEPFITETNGSDYAVDLLVESPFNIPGTSTPYSLRIQANKVFWQSQGGVQLRAGDIIMMQLVGTVLYDAGGYTKFTLVNGRTTAYTVPSEP